MTTPLPTSSVANILRDFLIEEGVGFTYNMDTDWAVSIMAQPRTPRNSITIYDEASQVRVRGHEHGIYEDPVVTIFIRSENPENGRYRTKLIMDAVDALRNWTWVGGSDDYSQTVEVASARRQRGIVILGANDNGLWEFNLEYILTINRVMG